MKLITNTNPDRITKIVAGILSFILLCAVLMACNPQRKLNKLIKNNPELVKSDTTWKDTTLTKAGTVDTAAVSLKKDSVAAFSSVDSLTNHFKDSTNAVLIDTLNKGFKGILTKALTGDTTITTKKGKYRIKRTPSSIEVDLVTDSVKTDFKYPTVINTVQPIKEQPKPGMIEQAALWLGKKVLTGLGCFLFLLLVYIVYRILKGSH